MATTEQSQGLDPKFLEDFAHRWMEAWNAHDGAALAALCTEDVVYEDPGLPEAARGRAGVAAFVERSHRAFPDYRFTEPEPGYPSATEQKAIVPWRMTGTFTGPIDPPGFAPTGKAFDIEGVDHWWFRDGLVSRCRGQWNMMQMAQELGVMPMPGSREEKGVAFLQRIRARGMRRRAS